MKKKIICQNDHIFIESPIILLIFQLIFPNVTIDLTMWCRSDQLIPFFIRAKPPQILWVRLPLRGIQSPASPNDMNISQRWWGLV